MAHWPRMHRAGGSRLGMDIHEVVERAGAHPPDPSHTCPGPLVPALLGTLDDAAHPAADRLGGRFGALDDRPDRAAGLVGQPADRGRLERGVAVLGIPFVVHRGPA